MYYVYALQSIIDKNWLYVGYSDDLKTRVKRHNQGKVKSTKSKKPLILVYYEAYRNKKDAAKREYELKNNNQQKEILKKKFKNSLLK